MKSLWFGVLISLFSQITNANADIASLVFPEGKTQITGLEWNSTELPVQAKTGADGTVETVAILKGKYSKPGWNLVLTKKGSGTAFKTEAQAFTFKIPITEQETKVTIVAVSPTG